VGLRKFGIPFKEGVRYFYFKNDGLQNQSVLHALTSLDAKRECYLINTFSEDGTVALSGIAISQDGELMAYGLSTSGSDWQGMESAMLKLVLTSQTS